MSQRTEQDLPQSRHYLPILNEPKERGIHSLQSNIQAGQQNAGQLGSGDSMLVLMHVYLVLTTTHYSQRVRDGKLGVGTASVLCIDMRKTRVHASC